MIFKSGSYQYGPFRTKPEFDNVSWSPGHTHTSGKTISRVLLYPITSNTDLDQHARIVVRRRRRENRGIEKSVGPRFFLSFPFQNHVEVCCPYERLEQRQGKRGEQPIVDVALVFGSSCLAHPTTPNPHSICLARLAILIFEKKCKRGKKARNHRHDDDDGSTTTTRTTTTTGSSFWAGKDTKKKKKPSR